MPNNISTNLVIKDEETNDNYDEEAWQDDNNQDAIEETNDAIKNDEEHEIESRDVIQDVLDQTNEEWRLMRCPIINGVSGISLDMVHMVKSELELNNGSKEEEHTDK